MSIRNHIIELRAAFNVYLTILDSLLDRVIEYETDPIRTFANAFTAGRRSYSADRANYGSSDSSGSSTEPSSPARFPSPPPLLRQTQAQSDIIDLDSDPEERVYQRINIEQYGK